MSDDKLPEPFAVTIAETGRRLGGKSRPGIYNDIGRGLLEAVKDGNRTLITTRSIEALQRSWPPAKIKPAASRPISRNDK
jgi:hypothetical protein